MTTAVGMIYIGTYAQADTDERNWSNENDNVFAGLHDKTVLKHVTTNVTTPKNDGIAYDDDQGQTASTITYNLGAGPVTATQDMVASYNVSIELGDGSVLNTVVNVIQLTNGATFINENANGLQLDGLSIRSIRLGCVVEENALGWYTARSISGARVVCFASGTRITTPDGDCAVEALKPGDLVQTQDHGPQPLLWCAMQVSTGQGKAAPVTIQSGALGANQPYQPLRVSRQHRVLIRSNLAVPLIGQEDVLVAAKDLIGLDGVDQAPSRGDIGYHHLLFAQHEVIFANGAACESFFPGPMAIEALSNQDRGQLQNALQQHNLTVEAYEICRPVLRGRQLRGLFKGFPSAARPIFAATGKTLPKVVAQGYQIHS
ncbi:Hint domain-containing protein [Pseudorhodobacter sp. W20_MBD10_FR17]|uniref:Hint domain-containing protein n=1 Tax=Pseudorhodobacter sp. W20_MBD10_FR17 TaxID=3240266 RepID=UPI003F9ABD47